MRALDVVLPNDVDDPATPSGGNAYDRRICAGLGGVGWTVREHAVPGAWPAPAPADRDRLARVLTALPDGAVALLDGLIASAVPDVLRPHAHRLRLAVLVHMPLGDAAEGDALGAAAAVVATSDWTRGRLIDLHGLAQERVHVARPGVDGAPTAPGSPEGSHLLCVAAVTPAKGHDVLVEALTAVADLPFTCVCIGSLTRDPAHAARLHERIRALGLEDRIEFPGPLAREELGAAYAAADLLVLPSRRESYGMVVTEALARGIPVLASHVGGVPEALGRAPDGGLPGALLPPGDAAALADALERWLRDPGSRDRLRRRAWERRTTLTGWDTTTGLVSTVLEGVAA